MSLTNIAEKKHNEQRHFLWLGLIALAVSEVLITSLLVDAKNIERVGIVALFLSHAGDVLKFGITSAAIFALFLMRDSANTHALLTPHKNLQRLLWILFLQLLVFGLFLLATFWLFGTKTPANGLKIAAWLISTLAVGVSFLALIAPLKNIGQLIARQKTALLVSSAGGLIVMLISLYSRALWEPLSAFTMHGSYVLLGLVYDDLYIDASSKLLGARDFIVHVSPQCSGIDGMALAIGITSAYLFFSRKSMRFPHAFLLIPIAGLLAIAFNVLRVATLVGIGASISERIAIEGFHSVAGWISSILIAMLIVFVFANLKTFSPQKHQEENDKPLEESDKDESDLVIAILTPFVVFLGATIVAQIVLKEFDTAYPIKMAIALPFLAYFWRSYKLKLPSRILEHILIGLLVAFLWVVVIPVNPEGNHTFQQSLFALPGWLVATWIGFRLIGFWLFAPVVEELVFRGYLLNKLSGEKLRTDGTIAFSVVGFLVSSIFFGLIHADWIAGSLAGALFALSRYRATTIGGPITAHVAANVFVGIWAIATSNWLLI